MAAITYPNPRQCSELLEHNWTYYRRKGEPGIYMCNRCNYRINKKLLKENTDDA
jgi:hypothetical protein